MKKVVFMIAVVIAAAFTTQAQQAKSKGNGNGNGQQKGQNLTPDQKADKITARLKTELSLTDAQVPQVKQATLTRINQAADAKTKAGADKQALGQQRKQIFQSWETQMKGILTPDQYNTYLAKKEEKKKQMQQRKADKQNGNGNGNNQAKPNADDDDEIGDY